MDCQDSGLFGLKYPLDEVVTNRDRHWTTDNCNGGRQSKSLLKTKGRGVTDEVSVCIGANHQNARLYHCYPLLNTPRSARPDGKVKRPAIRVERSAAIGDQIKFSSKYCSSVRRRRKTQCEVCRTRGEFPVKLARLHNRALPKARVYEQENCHRAFELTNGTCA